MKSEYNAPTLEIVKIKLNDILSSVVDESIVEHGHIDDPDDSELLEP